MAGRVIFDGVWKRFRRGMAHDSLRDLLPSLVRRRSVKKTQDDLGEGDFWAVRDVSFEVGPGQALGIIGGNGAGKSTTLKLLTKILQPTKGFAEIRGRAGALIEVSAGFHPDLTGRENIFLQGAIMGMPMSLIHERFDDIVEFSGVSAFIDTPIKRYSSGMNARLGFSIAAHLSPDVLIIDEVLSVGDAEFQGRAFERIRALVRAEIPVVIVSHQLDRVVELCTECILLRQGQIVARGEPTDVVGTYLSGEGQRVESFPDTANVGVELRQLTGPEARAVESGRPFSVVLTGNLMEHEMPADVEIQIIVVDAARNQRVYWNPLTSIGSNPRGRGEFHVEITLNASVPVGLYRIETAVWHERLQLIIGQGPSVMVQVVEGASFGGTHQLGARATTR